MISKIKFIHSFKEAVIFIEQDNVAGYDKLHWNSIGEVEEGEEEEEYSYVYTSRVCPAQLIRQQGEEEGEEENIYEEIGLHLPLAGPAHPADVQQQSLDASQSHLHLYRSIRSNPSIGRGCNWMKSNLKENL